MAEALPCPICNEAPKAGYSSRNPDSHTLECVSTTHPMLIIKTKPCGSPEAAIEVWNAGRQA